MKNIKFEKVSLEQFAKDVYQLIPGCTNEQIIETYNNIKLPQRSSKGSAGYDFYSPFAFVVDHEPVLVPLGIRAIMPEDVVLMIVPRSGVGFSTGVHLANTVGIIDSSYAGSSNEGHIMLKLAEGFRCLQIESGDRVVQGIFVPYLTTEDDEVATVRTGGLGSSGK